MERMTIVALLAFAFALSASATRAGGDSLIGLEIPPDPAGLRELQGTCLSDSDDPARVCDYGIAVLGTMGDADGDAVPQHIVAQRSLDRDGDQPRWRITDAVAYPRTGKDHWLQIGTCRVDGNDDGNVAALVRHDAGAEYSDDVTRAWRLDFASGRLQDIDPASVDCVNEGLGV
jgi:hypothetical protein